MLHCVAWQILTDISEKLTASIIRVMSDTTIMMEAVRPSETLVSIYQTAWCNIPEDSHLHGNEPSGFIEDGQSLVNLVTISFSRTVLHGVSFRLYITSAGISVFFSSCHFSHHIKILSCLTSNTEYFTMKP
jgi:hypothetical protein